MYQTVVVQYPCSEIIFVFHTAIMRSGSNSVTSFVASFISLFFSLLSLFANSRHMPLMAHFVVSHSRHLSSILLFTSMSSIVLVCYCYSYGAYILGKINLNQKIQR